MLAHKLQYTWTPRTSHFQLPGSPFTTAELLVFNQKLLRTLPYSHIALYLTNLKHLKTHMHNIRKLVSANTSSSYYTSWQSSCNLFLLTAIQIEASVMLNHRNCIITALKADWAKAHVRHINPNLGEMADIAT
eukprot:scaffold36428_cov20-Tisochrysis_lutea.AAC.1